MVLNRQNHFTRRLKKESSVLFLEQVYQVHQLLQGTKLSKHFQSAQYKRSFLRLNGLMYIILPHILEVSF